jgi:hypothetical protein
LPLCITRVRVLEKRRSNPWRRIGEPFREVIPKSIYCIWSFLSKLKHIYIYIYSLISSLIKKVLHLQIEAINNINKYKAKTIIWVWRNATYSLLWFLSSFTSYACCSLIPYNHKKMFFLVNLHAILSSLLMNTQIPTLNRFILFVCISLFLYVN